MLSRRTFLTTVAAALTVPATASAEEALKLAFIPQENPEKLLGDIEAITAWLSQQLEVPVTGFVTFDHAAAVEALRNGDLGAAGSAMERAIDDLRGGAEALARNQRDQEQGGQGEGGGTQFDPAGRRVGEGRGEGVEVPEISEADRSRAIIDTIRKRLGKPGREDEEVEYLERLLDDF